MQGRVIKFNLIGAICVLIAIITIIVMVIVHFVGKDDTNNSSTTNNETANVNDNNSKIGINVLETKSKIKENVTINGQKTEVLMEKFESVLGYSMNYSIDNFFIMHDAETEEESDDFASLKSNTITINISKHYEDFAEISEEILVKDINDFEGNTVKQYNSFRTYINTIEIVKERIVSEEQIQLNYYMKSEEGYFLVEAKIGLEFIASVEPVLEKMLNSFEIL